MFQTIVLNSDFECCFKYRHTLPSHVQLLSSYMEEDFNSVEEPVVQSTSSDEELDMAAKSRVSIFTPTPLDQTEDVLSMRIEPDFHETEEVEVVEELEGESESGSSVCSQWEWLQGRKKRRRMTSAEIDLAELVQPAGTKMLLKRPPSPESELVEGVERPKNMVEHRLMKYEGTHILWPQQLPLDELMLKRSDSPCTPTIPAETTGEYSEGYGEDWVWAEESFGEDVSMWQPDAEYSGEGEEQGYFETVHQTFYKGRWIPSPAYVRREAEKAKLAREEEIKLAEELERRLQMLKRPSSPEVSIIPEEKPEETAQLHPTHRTYIQDSSYSYSPVGMPKLAGRQKLIPKFPSEDLIPNEMKQILFVFFKKFLTDLPDQPLDYAIAYFEDIVRRPDDLQSVPRYNVLQDIDYTKPYVQNGVEVELISRAMMNSRFLRNMLLPQKWGIIGNMVRVDVKVNDVICSNVEPTIGWYVIQKGTFKVYKAGNSRIIRENSSFGEQSIFLKIKTDAKVLALTDGVLWFIAYPIVRSILREQSTIFYDVAERNMLKFHIFNKLTRYERLTLIDCFQHRYFKKYDVIFLENTDPEGMIFLFLGTVKTINIDSSKVIPKTGCCQQLRIPYEDDDEVQQLFEDGLNIYNPHVFGCQHLVEPKLWKRTCIAESDLVWVGILGKEVFARLVGDVDDILRRDSDMTQPGQNTPTEFGIFEGESNVGRFDSVTTPLWSEEVEDESEHKGRCCGMTTCVNPMLCDCWVDSTEPTENQSEK